MFAHGLRYRAPQTSVDCSSSAARTIAAGDSLPAEEALSVFIATIADSRIARAKGPIGRKAHPARPPFRLRASPSSGTQPFGHLPLPRAFLQRTEAFGPSG
jgi:hypothetical protein